MNLQLARQSYRRVAQADVVAPDDPHAVIGVALAELHRSLDVLATAVEGGLPLPAAPTTRVLSAIYLLQSSLDFDNGGEIAPALFRVYEFCRVKVLEAFRRDPAAEGGAGLRTAAGFVASLQTAWTTMDRNAAQAVTA